MRQKIFIILIVISLVLARPAAAQEPNHPFPRTANYFLHWSLAESQAKELAKWDVVILDMEVQARRPDLLRKMREWNPNIILLVYIAPQEVLQNATASGSALREKFARGLPDSWYVVDAGGARLGSWPGTTLVNVTAQCPIVNGERYQSYVTRFVTQELLSTGLWDGVFYDNAWDSVTYFVGSNVDLNKDGAQDANPDAAWRAGMRAIYEDTRRLTNSKYFIVGNGTTRVYSDALNGAMFENFSPSGWAATMETYKRNEKITPYAPLNIINANTANRGGQFFSLQNMRFGLASALMEDGYFSYDYGDTDHGQAWQYDEYGVNLGQPRGDAKNGNSGNVYTSDVWRREFDHGIAVVNSSEAARTVDLGGEYEKIHGTQDTTVNDGSIVSETTVGGGDGQILLKTFATLDDVLIPNGSFVRFFHADGTRARNGFFLFEDGYKAGDQVGRIDLDGNGLRDLLVISNGQISARRDDGVALFAEYPYGANYSGELRVAVGDLKGDKQMNIVVAPPPGVRAPIKVYSVYGDTVQSAWWPFGTGYSGGYTVAVGNVDGKGSPEIIVGAGKGRYPTVTLFTSAFKKIREWYSYEARFRGGVAVATGDVNGDGVDEVIVSPEPGGRPLVKIFNDRGKSLYPQFSAFGAIGYPGLGLTALDVDFDGKDEIVGVSKDVGL